MGELPTGTVTFLFTDIEGSTVRWEQHPARMKAALSRHNAIMREAIDRHGGALYETAGDSFVVAFGSAPPALDTALWAQRTLTTENWPHEIGPLRVRMALHTGAAEMRPDGYYAQHTLSRQARLLSTAHGGQILLSRATRDLVAGHLPDAVDLLDMGELVLKDLIDPEQVFQIVAPDPPWSLPAEFPPLRSERTRLDNAPRQALQFVGRQREVAELTRTLIERPVRILTLLGPGGIGKTRLALRTAERVQHRFVDGVHFVDLATVTDPDLVLPAIATSLGLREDDGRPLAGALVDHVRERRLLLVLDNLEQVVGCAPHVAGLLQTAPELQILATSRIPLQIAGEANYQVAPLGLPDLRRADDVTTLAEVDAVALFVERARAAARDFALTNENAAAVAAICHRLEGIPLALVLAAARSEVLSPRAMLGRLDDRLALLVRGTGDLPARHRTLRTTIEWSYDLLEADEQRQYALWSVFSGGFRIEAAEALGARTAVGALDALDGLSALVDSSLLTSTDTFDDERRFHMLDTIGEHAREKLVELGPADAPARLHAEYFVGFAEEAARHLEGEHLVYWSTRLEEDHDNLRAALAWGFGQAEHGDVDAVRVTVRLAAALSLFWYDRGYLTEGGEHLRRSSDLVPLWLQHAADDDDRRRALGVAATIQYNLGGMHSRRGDFPGAERCLDAALALYRELDDLSGQARALASLGTVSFTRRDLDEARDRHARGLALSQAAGDRFNVVNGLIALGNIAVGGTFDPMEQQLYERATETLRTELVADRFAEHRRAGRAMDLEAAVGHALDDRTLPS